MPTINCGEITLNNGVKMPRFGLGTWQSEPGLVTKAVECAIDLGYRHIDCAHIYMNEPEVGLAIKNKISEGVIKRDELFITSKLWNSFHNPEHVEAALETTLTNLGLDYLDLYLIHWPVSLDYTVRDDGTITKEEMFGEVNDTHYVETWKKLASLLPGKKIKSIGVSNFNILQLKDIIENSTTVPAMNQVEAHIYWNQRELIDFCHAKGIQITAYSPLGSPRRPETMLNQEDPVVMEDETLTKIAAHYEKTTAQVLIKWSIQRGCVCIPKSVTPARIQQNSEIFDFQISEEDMAALEGVAPKLRVCNPVGWWGKSKFYPW